MRKNNLILILIAAITIFIASCSKEDSTVGTDKYTGTWTCVETPSSGASTTFSITISKFGNEDTLNVFNFDNLGSNEKAIFIVSDNSIVIPSQSVSGFAVSGYGTYTGSKLNLTYKVDADNYTALCSQ